LVVLSVTNQDRSGVDPIQNGAEKMISRLTRRGFGYSLVVSVCILILRSFDRQIGPKIAGQSRDPIRIGRGIGTKGVVKVGDVQFEIVALPKLGESEKKRDRVRAPGDADYQAAGVELAANQNLGDRVSNLRDHHHAYPGAFDDKRRTGISPKTRTSKTATLDFQNRRSLVAGVGFEPTAFGL
jgi:hypothetical protein